MTMLLSIKPSMTLTMTSRRLLTLPVSRNMSVSRLIRLPAPIYRSQVPLAVPRGLRFNSTTTPEKPEDFKVYVFNDVGSVASQIT
jgi:hypothetical protein